MNGRNECRQTGKALDARHLGHSQVQTTARYAHLARHWAKTAAARIADSLAVYVDTPRRTSFTT